MYVCIYVFFHVHKNTFDRFMSSKGFDVHLYTSPNSVFLCLFVVLSLIVYFSGYNTKSNLNEKKWPLRLFSQSSNFYLPVAFTFDVFDVFLICGVLCFFARPENIG